MEPSNLKNLNIQDGFEVETPNETTTDTNNDLCVFLEDF